jgi:hypothetical protein
METLDLISELVLQYAGPDQWLFLGVVNKIWAAFYSVVVHEPACRSRREAITAVVRKLKVTSFSEAAASLARVLYACDCDATLLNEKLLPLSKAAACCGSIDVLAWAKATAGTKWLAWHHQLCMAAAAGNQLVTLQWLRTSNPEQQWEVVKVATKAAEFADLSMLRWFVEQHSDWTVDSVQTVIESAAGASDAIDKMSWLRQRFAAYDRLIHHFIRASITCGAVPTLKWCASRGFRFLQ